MALALGFSAGASGLGRWHCLQTWLSQGHLSPEAAGGGLRGGAWAWETRDRMSCVTLGGYIPSLRALGPARLGVNPRCPTSSHKTFGNSTSAPWVCKIDLEVIIILIFGC